MRKDSYGYLEMEHVAYPGSIGDATAETFRNLGLDRFIEFTDGHKYPLSTVQSKVLDLYRGIRTDKGFLRHPNAPEPPIVPKTWREPDFSGDQATALLLGLDAWDLHHAAADVAASNRFFYGNGTLVHPTFVAVRKRAQRDPSLFWDGFILAQAAALKWSPIRWSDADDRKWYQRIERTTNASGDWLNFAHMIFQASRVGHTFATDAARNLVSANEVLAKIRHYYESKKEPNIEWLLEKYAIAIPRAFR